MYKDFKVINKNDLEYFELTEIASISEKLDNDERKSLFEKIESLVPNKFYKYRNFENKNIFKSMENRKIWLSSPNDWKDQTDFNFSFDMDTENIEESNKESTLFKSFVYFGNKLKNNEEINLKYQKPNADVNGLLNSPCPELFLMQDAMEYSNTCLGTNYNHPLQFYLSGNFFDVLDIMISSSCFGALMDICKERKRVRDNYLIYCMSKDFDVSKQWEDYADNGNGFCIEYSFKNKKDFLNRINYQIYPVLYGERPKIKLSHLYKACNLDINVSMQIQKEFTDNKMISLFTKDKSYIGEEEWRIVLNRSQFSNEFDFDYISAIYIGDKVEKENEDKLIQISKQLNAKIYKRTFNDLTSSWDYKEIR